MMRWFLWAWGVFCLTAVAVRADDFRVESIVFANKQKEPISRSTTLFHAGVVYDYLGEPPRVAVLDQAHGRFILLDETRQEKAELKLDEIATAAASLRSMAEKSPNSFLKFVANPKFSIESQENDEIVFRSPTLIYRTKCVQATPDAAAKSREFLDWTARLNAIMTPAAPPPFARLAINEELANRNLVAESVELDIPKQMALGGRGLNLRSEHVLTWRLLETDQDRIAKSGAQMAKFKLIPFAEYRSHQPE
jgi:hypothetical protein